MTSFKHSSLQNKLKTLGFVFLSFSLIFSLVTIPAQAVSSEPTPTDSATSTASIPSDFQFNLEIPLPTENTSELCHDGIDNNGNFLVDASDPDCTVFYPVATTTPPLVENTSVLCHDGIDNNGNFLVDASDPDCTSFFNNATSTEIITPTQVENTDTLCHDSIDNDGDFLVDASDPDCTPFYVQGTSTPPTESTPPTDDRLNPNAATAVSGGGGSSLPTGPAVLGASTTDDSGGVCSGPYILTYMRFGQNNDIADVARLQLYLNTELGKHIPVSGSFGLETDGAVRELQGKYSNDIMKPWVDAGLTTDLTPSGYVFKTTRWFINNRMNNCEGVYPFPTLR